MQTSLRGITTKAKQEKNYRFGNLYGLIDKNALYTAWKSINKNASAGVDKESTKQFKENLDQNLSELLEHLKQKKYKAKLIKRDASKEQIEAAKRIAGKQNYEINWKVSPAENTDYSSNYFDLERVIPEVH